MPDRLKRLLRNLPALLGLLLLFGAVYVVQREFRHLKIADIGDALEAIPHRTLLLGFACTVAAYCILTFYDRLGTRFAGHPVGHRRAAFASFCAYALAHNLGFSAVSGAAVRYRLYSNWGLKPLEIGKLVAFCSLTFGLGGMTLGGGVLLGEARAVPYFGQHFPIWALHAIGIGMWAVVGGYLVASLTTPELRRFGHTLTLPRWPMAIAQILLACCDISVTASIVYVLLPAAPGLTYPRLLAVYIASYSAGLIATLPAGLGVFDSVMLLGLAPYLPAPAIAGAIVVFRLYYYIIPLFLAGSLFAGNEILLRGRVLLRRPAPVATPRWSEPDFAVAAGTAAVALCGFLLLSLGAVEQRPEVTWFDPDFAYVASQAGEFAPSLIGAALLVMAAALSRRVNLAWGTTILLLLAAAVFTWAQDEPSWIPGVLLLAGLLIAPYRSAFYRHARLLTGAMRPSVAVPLVVLLVCVTALALFERHVRWLGDDSFWKVILSSDVPNSIRISTALAVALGMTSLWRLLKPGRVSWLVWDADAAQAFAELGGPRPARADGLVWGEAERAAIAFRRVGGLLLALGDPAGAVPDRVSAIWRLRDLARQEGRDPAIWGARRGMLEVYADLGLAALPLGPDGLPAAADTAGVADRFLACVTERDLPTLLPLLPELARDRTLDTAPDPTRQSPELARA
jgi:uncharacterized membrane protein YbhN (UPF0104 family)